MEERYLEQSWQVARARFDELKSFVVLSEKSMPRGDLGYRTNLYMSWVLLTYAGAEAALINLGKESIKIFGRYAPTPEDLPQGLRKVHIRRTLTYLYYQSSSNRYADDFDDMIKNIVTVDWWRLSKLTSIDGNVWPDRVGEWLERLLVERDRLLWLERPIADGTDTAHSRLRELVEERNLLAHGDLPDQVRNADLMCAWIDDILTFVRKCTNTLQGHLADLFSIPGVAIGDVNSNIPLGDSTVGFLEIHMPLSVGDHVRLLSANGVSRVASIVSMQTSSTSLETAAVGSQHIAVTFNRKVRGDKVLTVL